MRLDIYAWLTLRMSYLQRQTVIPWEALRFQFGSTLKDTKQGRLQFKRDVERHPEGSTRRLPGRTGRGLSRLASS